MGVYVKGTPKEGEYKLIKTTDGFVLDGKDIAYACTEIDLERDIPTIWYNRQTGQYEPKGTKQEVYERLYKLKNGERRADDPD